MFLINYSKGRIDKYTIRTANNAVRKIFQSPRFHSTVLFVVTSPSGISKRERCNYTKDDEEELSKFKTLLDFKITYG